MERPRRAAPAMSLYRVATVIFAGAVVLPNLLLAYLLMRAGVLGRGEAGLGLIAAVVMGVLGLFALRGVVGRIGRLARDLQAPAGAGEAAGLVPAGPLLIPEAAVPGRLGLSPLP